VSGIDPEALRSWTGRRREERDSIAAWPVRAMRATLDRASDEPLRGEPLPPAWHWLYFLEAAPATAIAADGHPRRGDFLPPVPLPRRMWAGGRIQWHDPLRVGDIATRVSEIVRVEPKQGRSGVLVFVTVRHSLATERGLALVEEHDIVYREAPIPGSATVSAPPEPGTTPPAAAWHRRWWPDEVMLFRYSALTFNGHRIHYDQPYVTGEEGYPGLVVHGPLQATLLLVLAASALPDRRLARFDYRALSPAFAGAPLDVHGQPDADTASPTGEARVWASTAQGRPTMSGTVQWVAAD